MKKTLLSVSVSAVILAVLFLISIVICKLWEIGAFEQGRLLMIALIVALQYFRIFLIAVVIALMLDLSFISVPRRNICTDLPFVITASVAGTFFLVYVSYLIYVLFNYF